MAHPGIAYRRMYLLTTLYLLAGGHMTDPLVLVLFVYTVVNLALYCHLKETR